MVRLCAMPPVPIDIAIGFTFLSLAVAALLSIDETDLSVILALSHLDVHTSVTKIFVLGRWRCVVLTCVDPVGLDMPKWPPFGSRRRAKDRIAVLSGQAEPVDRPG